MYTKYNVNIKFEIQLESSGPEVIKLFSCSTQLSMKFYLLINSVLLISTVVFLLSSAESKIFSAYMKMPTLVGIFIFISRENFMLS